MPIFGNCYLSIACHASNQFVPSLRPASLYFAPIVTPPSHPRISQQFACTSTSKLFFSLLVIRASSPQLLWLRFVIIRHLTEFNKCLRAGNCCLRHPFSPVLEPRQGGDICSLAGLTWPHVIFSSNNVLLAVQAWGTPSAWRHVPRPPIRWVSSGRWVISEPCQYIPCPLLPTTSSRVFSARHNIKRDFSIK